MFLSSNCIATSPASLGKIFFNILAGFLGKIKDATLSPLASSVLYLTNLYASEATKVMFSSVISKYTPFITGRNSSLAVANKVLFIPVNKVDTGKEKDIDSSDISGNLGYSAPLCPMKLYFPYS